MKPIIFLASFLFNVQVVFSQNNLEEFNKERVSITKNAMAVLGSWGTVNAITGAIGMASSNGEAKYFYQMNLIWGATNLLIAAPTFFSLKHRENNLSLAETVKRQSGIEKTFLINAALDLVYITAGGYCIQRGNNELRHHDLYNGYGKSLLLQGSGLLIFDVTMSLINIHHGKKLYKILSSIQVSGNSAGIVWNM